MTGKTKRFRGMTGKREDFKKFYVTLPEGSQIESLAV
jgi:large subunit ribosomal protein L23